MLIVAAKTVNITEHFTSMSEILHVCTHLPIAKVHNSKQWCDTDGSVWKITYSEVKSVIVETSEEDYTL